MTDILPLLEITSRFHLKESKETPHLSKLVSNRDPRHPLICFEAKQRQQSRKNGRTWITWMMPSKWVRKKKRQKIQSAKPSEKHFGFELRY